jgi:hypothetical protein
MTRGRKSAAQAPEAREEVGSREEERRWEGGVDARGAWGNAGGVLGEDVGRKMREYQREVAGHVLRSVEGELGVTFTVMMARQMEKNEDFLNEPEEHLCLHLGRTAAWGGRRTCWVGFR